jgi:hypothetical protein
VREVPITGVPHPLADLVAPGYLITESRAPVIFLSSARVNLLAQAAEAGVVVILVTDELSCLTPAFAQLWREAGAGWVVRGGDGGLRDGFTGKQLGEIADVLTATRVSSVDDVAVGFLRPFLADCIEVLATISLRHRAKITTVLGAPIAGLAELTGSARRLAWGSHEPVGQSWDRDALTIFARGRMPADTLLVAAGPDVRATLTVRRTEEGVEEITQAHLGFGTPSTIDFEQIRGRLVRYLADLTATSMPLVGLISARPSRRDLLVPPFLQHAPTPLALLVGPPVVRSFDLPVAELEARFGAQRVGRPRIPGLLFSLGSLGDPTWERLDEILATFPRDRLDEVLGLSDLDRPDSMEAGHGE